MRSVSGHAGGEVKSGGWTLLARLGRAALDVVYPPGCLACNAPVLEPGTLCPDCWTRTPFIAGLVCERCGAPQPGSAHEAPVSCDDCLRIARPWSRGRAALAYGDLARQMVLGLKHGDRHEIARPAGRWMAQAAAGLVRPDTLVAPVPLHAWRQFRRRYNQSALLAAALARAAGLPHCPDLLHRTRPTQTQDGRSRTARFENLQGAIRARPARAGRIPGRHILLVDDVMTSGATLAACAEACFAAGADDVDVVVMARVLHDEA